MPVSPLPCTTWSHLCLCKVGVKLSQIRAVSHSLCTGINDDTKVQENWGQEQSFQCCPANILFWGHVFGVFLESVENFFPQKHLRMLRKHLHYWASGRRRIIQISRDIVISSAFVQGCWDFLVLSHYLTIHALWVTRSLSCHASLSCIRIAYSSMDCVIHVLSISPNQDRWFSPI